MAKKISQLTGAGALTGTEEVPVVQSGATVKTTTQDIANLGGGGSQDLQDVLTQGSVLTADASIVPNADLVGQNVEFGTSALRFKSLELWAGTGHLHMVENGDPSDEFFLGHPVQMRFLGGQSILTIGVSGHIFDDADFNKGLVYAADYSANYTTRSLVDKGYVDSIVGGVTSVSGTTDRITSTGGATPVIDIAATYIGQATITTVGTLTSGATGAGFTVALGTSTVTGTLAPTNGGTGVNTVATGDILYGSAANTWSKLAAVAIGSYLGSRGTTTAPAWVSLEYVTPEMYGAVGDGSTDDSTAFNNAVASGKAIMLGSKNYRVATTITTADNTYIFGNGLSSIISVATNIAAITIGGINGTISNLQILGSGTGAAQNGITAVGNGSFNLYRYNTRVTNVFFNDLGNAGMYTINTIGNDSGSEHQGTYYAENCRAFSCAVGYLMDTRGEYNTFVNCLADNCATGVRFNGGNNSWTGGNVVDCTVGVFIGSGTNDGHGVITGAKINHTNITCSSTATGYAFVGCEIVATSITLTSCTDIRFYNCDIASSPITSTNAVGTILYGNCFRTTPTITVAAGNNPIFSFNTFPAASTVHSLVLNTVQGGISQTQQGPTSPNTFTSTWTTTASAQYSHRWDGTITPRATASDVFNVAVYDVSITATAANQQIYVMNINPAATLSTGGQSGAAVGALRVRGKTRNIGLATSGAVTGSSGWSYEDSAGATVLQISDDGILRIGNAGSPCQIFPTSDGLVINKAGNGMIASTGGIGFNINSTATGAGLSNAHGLGVNGGSSITSGALSWAAIYLVPTYNQTGTATGDVLGIDYNPTITALLGNHYFIRNRSIAANSAFAMTAAPTALVHIGAVTAGSASLCINPGATTTAPSSPVSGDIWHEGTGNRLMFRQGGTSTEIIATSAINSVSPTAPDRTITVLLNNVTYYLHAKTTND